MYVWEWGVCVGRGDLLSVCVGMGGRGGCIRTLSLFLYTHTHTPLCIPHTLLCTYTHISLHTHTHTHLCIHSPLLHTHTIFIYIQAEVQALFHDGSVALHTRSRRFGKLPGGVVVQVPHGLVERQKQHLASLPELGVCVCVCVCVYVCICVKRVVGVCTCVCICVYKGCWDNYNCTIV